MKNIVVAIYYHPEAYPPTLNAISSLSRMANIYVLHRPHLNNSWTYPQNVHLHSSGKLLNAKQQEESSIISKVFFFLKFLWDLRRLLVLKKPSIVILYDPIPLFAYYLIRWSTTNKPFLWYHSHDVAEIHKTRKYSIGWFATKFEPKTFVNLDLFTLPSLERKIYFPLNQLKGKFIFLPNLPCKQFYSQFLKTPKVPTEPVRLIYQGSISEGHGLENIIPILSFIVEDRKLELHLAGRISERYRKELIRIAIKYDVLSQVIFYGIIPYRELPALTITCDIGIAIHEPREIIYQTGGTASNKIYEYAACGLPILYFRNEHYSHYLGKYPWAIPIDLNESSIKNAIRYICNDYTSLSAQAKNDFAEDLNFEKGFINIIEYLKSVCLN